MRILAVPARVRKLFLRDAGVRRLHRRRSV